MANFWQSLKNNWNNGNFLKWTNFGANVGMSAIATYGVMDSVFSGKSPYGCGWGYSGCCNSLYPNLGAINTIMQRNAWNPMGIVNDPMAQMMLGNNSMLGMSSMIGMPSMMGFPDMMSGGMPWMNGGMPWMNGSMNYGNYPFTTFNNQTSSTTDNDKKKSSSSTDHKTYNHDAVALTDTSTTAPTFDNKLIGDSVTEGEDIKISEGHTSEDVYKTNLKNSANALGNSWDTNNDNFVSESEFTTKFMENYDGLKEAKKRTLFVQLDLNDDNKLDANELSAMLWHMDASDATSGSTPTNDGKITSKGFNTWLSSIQTVAGRTKMNTYYTEKLFKED